MGRKNNVCVPNVPCDSMEHTTIKVRPVLLNRSVDISDLTKQTNQRKIKSHQVRFKEDNTKPSSPNFTELDIIKAPIDTLLVNGKVEKSHSRPMCLLANSHSQIRLKNIATQTSPSLRKHFPNFKTRKVKETRPKDIVSSESSCELINGDLTGEVIADKISCLRLTDQFEEGLKWVRRRCPVKHTVPKAQSNGPRNVCSGMEFVEILGRVTVSTQVSENVIVSSLQETEETNVIKVQNHPSPETVDDYLMLECSEKCSLTIDEPSDISMDLTALKQSKELLPVKPNVDCKRTLTLTPSINRNVSYCIHSKLQQTDKMQSLSASHLHDSHVLQSNKDRSQMPHRSIRELQKKPAHSSTLCLPNNGMNQGTNNESKLEIPGHEVPSECYSLQGKLQSIEEVLQSNKEKIKILLNVIEDLEKAKAFSEGRIFYRTGQDLNNCSTCQSRACIIYSVEYDFRQQEERFLHIVKNLEALEPGSVLIPAPKSEPESRISKEPVIRRKTKKVKKKCFWWI